MRRVLARGEWDTGKRQLGPAGFLACGWRNARVAGDSRVMLALDGHIYNNDRPDRDDCSFFLDLYRNHGFRRALEQLNGDFALALYDLGTDELWLARDRIGLNPCITATPTAFLGLLPGPAPCWPAKSRQGLEQRFRGPFRGKPLPDL